MQQGFCLHLVDEQSQYCTGFGTCCPTRFAGDPWSLYLEIVPVTWNFSYSLWFLLWCILQKAWIALWFSLFIFFPSFYHLEATFSSNGVNFPQCFFGKISKQQLNLIHSIVTHPPVSELWATQTQMLKQEKYFKIKFFNKKRLPKIKDLYIRIKKEDCGLVCMCFRDICTYNKMLLIGHCTFDFCLIFQKDLLKQQPMTVISQIFCSIFLKKTKLSVLIN